MIISLVHYRLCFPVVLCNASDTASLLEINSNQQHCGNLKTILYEVMLGRLLSDVHRNLTYEHKNSEWTIG